MAKKTSRNATDKAMTPVDSRHGCANPARADSGLSGYGDQAQLRFKRILAEAPLFRFLLQKHVRTSTGSYKLRRSSGLSQGLKGF